MKSPQHFIFLVLALVCFLSPAVAQEVTHGEVFNGAAGYEPVVIGEDANNFYVYANTQGKKMAVEAFDRESGSKLYSTRIDDEKKVKYTSEIEEVTHYGQGFVVIYSNYDKKSKQLVLYAKTVDGETGELSSNEIFLAEEELEKRRQKGTYAVSTSQDKSKFFVSFFYANSRSGVNISRRMVLGDGFEVLFEDEQNSSELPSASSVIVDNEGSLYSMSWISGKLHVVTYDAYRDYERWEEEVEFDFGTSNMCIMSNIFMKLSANNEVVLTALVKENTLSKFGGWEMIGSAMAVLDYESKELRLKNFNRFDDDAKINANFRFGDMFLRADGQVVTILEVYYFYVTYDQDGFIIEQRHTFGDLLVVGHNAEGALSYAQRIQKRQVYSEFRPWWWSPILFTSAGPRFVAANSWKTIRHFGYGCALEDDKVVVFYNEHPKNLLVDRGTKLPKKFKKVKRGVVCAYEIDLETGDYERSANFALSNTNSIMCPRMNYQANEHSNMYMFNARGNKFSFSIIEW